MSETPMMRQYKGIKSQYPEEIVFFRLGDFYEMFLDDAKEASQILNLTLTARHGIPMCGIPYHAAKNYIRRLLEAGKKIAICEQTKLPENGKGLAEREVVQIITPGTVVDDDLLISGINNYILSVALIGKQISLSYADLSTGEFVVSLVTKEANYESLRRYITKLQPVEILIQESVYFEDEQFRRAVEHEWTMITRYPDWHFDISQSEDLLKKHFKTAALQHFGFEKNDKLLKSTGVLYTYLSHTSKKSLIHVYNIKLEYESEHLIVDESSQKNLELVRNMHDNTEKYTLFSSIKHTKTASGTRLLRKWILSPLNSIDKIEERHSYIDLLYHNQILQNKIRIELSSVLDIERLCSRLSLQKASPKDLISIGSTIEHVAVIISLSEKLNQYILRLVSAEKLKELFELQMYIDKCINKDVNGPFSEGKVIRDGFNPELDKLRNIKIHAVSYLDNYSEKLIQETSLPKIKIKYNRIIGYYIEVSKLHTDKVPNYFIRKQTLVNGERYTTDELTQLERKIQSSYQEAELLERTIYQEILSVCMGKIESLLKLSECLSKIDCYQSMAFSAVRNGYSKPIFSVNSSLQIINGRHPVVELNLPPGEFVSNSLECSSDTGKFALITGPNMAGKSTFLRQTALIVLLAHIGSYVPADSAVMGIHDKIFCRVGATDNLARGESTFLVEMMETSYILRNATKNSLIIMDEVGRGTSTQDGVSIAFAVMKKLISISAETLFATHYHELTVFNDKESQHLYLEVLETDGKIVFLNKIRKGNTSSSYGLHAARLAGLPLSVLRSAETYQKIHAKHEIQDVESLQKDLENLFTEEPEYDYEETKRKKYEEIVHQLDTVNIDEMTPRGALTFLYELKNYLNENSE
ncbi:MAG: DNA mismatch repair protein MutS [Bacteroidetes bacterium]|nr:DNA mismatch repair protein MutS [Bacteroidota bacterium]